MRRITGKSKPAGGTFLVALARDRRGSTLAIMAAMLVPMTALAGSAIDTARLYVVKVRLQQACDAGVLAGRKFMASTSGTTLDDDAATKATTFFRNNFATGWMGTASTAFTPVKTSDSQVSGSASTAVPMTIMRIFGMNPVTVAVTCQARYDVADTDVLFVLDTTGSMACLPGDSDSACGSYVGSAAKIAYNRPSTSNGVGGYAGATGYGVQENSSGSRIAAVRSAVLDFYDTFARAADPSTKIRYGFVTYSSSVNVGKAILDVAPGAIVGSTSGDTASYQSRKVYTDYAVSYSDSANGKTQEQCNAFVATRDPVLALTYDSSSGNATRVSNVWLSSGGRNPTYRCYTRTIRLGPQYQYAKLPWDVSAVVGGSVVTNPTKVRGQQMRWLGCVETPVDTPGQSSFTTTALPAELNPDITPTGAKRWTPQMQDLEYVRNDSYTDTSTYYTNGDDWNRAPGYGSDAYVSAAEDYQKGGFVACGKPVKRLDVMTRSDVSAYVSATDFVPVGGTYHDTGMIWGSRLISPSGPWAADTAAWPGHNAPNRVIVFLTDGDMAPSVASYSMYGMEGYDNRVGNGSTDDATLIDLHNKRFLAACAAAKARNVDVWTVQIDTTASTEMKTCATTAAQALYTTTGSGLSDIFATIAKKLAMLRISA